MSKSLSLETRTIYQLSLIAIGTVSLILVGFSIFQATKLFNMPKDEPVIKIREQQLNTAIKLVVSPKDVH